MTPNDTSSLDAVRAWVEQRHDELLDALGAYIACRGVSATGEGIAGAAEHAVGLCAAAGIEASVRPGSHHPFVVGHSAHDPAKPTVLIYGHYDVQPAGDEALWDSPPFETAVRDGRVYGRGVVDNKGQHLAYLLALRALQETAGGLPCNVKLLLDGEEEIGSGGMAPFVREHAGELAADLALWSDGPVGDDRRPTVGYGLRGAILFEIHLRSGIRQLHSGNFSGLAPNMAWELTWLLSTICGPDGLVKLEGFYDGIERYGGADAEAIAEFEVSARELVEQLGVTELPPPRERTPGERLSAYPIFTLNAIVTGEGNLDARPIIPNRASAYCDIRLVPGQRTDAVIESLRRHFAEHAPHAELVVTGTMEPSATPMGAPYSAAVLRGVEVGSGMTPRRIPAYGGGLPIYAFTEILGLPTFGIPFANRDGGNHGPNENFEVDRFLGAIVTSAGALLEIGAERG